MQVTTQLESFCLLADTQIVANITRKVGRLCMRPHWVFKQDCAAISNDMVATPKFLYTHVEY